MSNLVSSPRTMASSLVQKFMKRFVDYEFWQLQQKRFRQQGAKVQQRSPKKRVWELENVIDKQKSLSKVLTVMDILKREPEQVMEVRFLGHFKSQLNFANDFRLLEFLKKYHNIFELYMDSRKITWVGFTRAAEALLEEERQILKNNEHTALTCVRKFLMMSIDKKLQVDKIAHFRNEFLLPVDFRKRWIYKFPEYFKVVTENDRMYLELTSWDPALAVTEVEKKAKEKGILNAGSDLGKDWLKLPFPLKHPSNFQLLNRHYKATREFQELVYLSPYADPSCMEPGTKPFEKRAVAVLHEMLSLTLEKKIVTDHLTHFRHEFKLPQKLMRFFLRHFGIFYVSQKGKRFSVFLTTAYDGSRLIEMTPLSAWKEKVFKLMGEKKRGIQGKLAYQDHDEDTIDYAGVQDDNEELVDDNRDVNPMDEISIDNMEDEMDFVDIVD